MSRWVGSAEPLKEMSTPFVSSGTIGS